MLNERRIAVLGSTGQLGETVLAQLGDRGVGLSRSQFDLGDMTAARELLHRLEPVAVINAAAYTKVDLAESNRHECFRINADAVAHLAEICADLDAALVQISTDYVFGADAARTEPYREDDPPGPQSIYAQSKLAGELAARTCKRHLIVRTCGLYGERFERPHVSFVKTMLRLAGERDHVRIVDDQHCTPTYVRDAARGILFLLDQRCCGTYHLVNRGQTTWHRFALEIFRLINTQIHVEPITTEEYGAAAPRPRYSVLDTAKIEALGCVLPTWQSALADCLALGAKRSCE